MDVSQQHFQIVGNTFETLMLNVSLLSWTHGRAHLTDCWKGKGHTVDGELIGTGSPITYMFRTFQSIIAFIRKVSNQKKLSPLANLATEPRWSLHWTQLARITTEVSGPFLSFWELFIAQIHQLYINPFEYQSAIIPISREKIFQPVKEEGYLHENIQWPLLSGAAVFGQDPSDVS